MTTEWLPNLVVTLLEEGLDPDMLQDNDNRMATHLVVTTLEEGLDPDMLQDNDNRMATKSSCYPS